MQKVKKLAICSACVFFLLFLLYGLFIEPNRIEISHVEIKADALNHTLKGKTAVHLSDLHINTVGKREKEILRIIDDLKPDLIFLTGDYVKWSGNYEEALSFLSRLEAPMGVWAVMGDYDYSSSRKSCLFCHEQGSGKPTGRHQVRFLKNEIAQSDFLRGAAWLGGVDSDAESDSIAEIPTEFLRDKTPAIILSHNPLLFDALEKNQDILVLAGDTHGGQVPLPSLLWQILGYRKNALYNRGFFQEGMKKMYVSVGIGTSHLPLRFLRTPELVVLHF
jgi:hypothetical protein